MLTKYDWENSKLQGNCCNSWCTQSSHCRNTGHRSLGSSPPTVWPQRSANLCPKSSHSLSHKTWKPCNQNKVNYITLNLKKYEKIDISLFAFEISVKLWHRQLQFAYTVCIWFELIMGETSPKTIVFKVRKLPYLEVSDNMKTWHITYLHRYFPSTDIS